jgi:hypothetical protein
MKDCNKCTECICEEMVIEMIRIDLIDFKQPNKIKQCQLPKIKQIILNKAKTLFKGDVQVSMCFRNNKK